MRMASPWPGIDKIALTVPLKMDLTVAFFGVVISIPLFTSSISWNSGWRCRPNPCEINPRSTGQGSPPLLFSKERLSALASGVSAFSEAADEVLAVLLLDLPGAALAISRFWRRLSASISRAMALLISLFNLATCFSFSRIFSRSSFSRDESSTTNFCLVVLSVSNSCFSLSLEVSNVTFCFFVWFNSAMASETCWAWIWMDETWFLL